LVKYRMGGIEAVMESVQEEDAEEEEEVVVHNGV